ncbi:putative Mg2+ transporter-C (MgtC) family protein [Azospirillum lipoferum]|uniref:Protein MgtC n=1 Tax=Azospirillum lipoferum TaxID=193 RepID=A0A5A9GT05_AZOLI|nr:MULTISPECIES: MgtC/SapB family protein [Azospirillum]KAA0596935.1 MgtC/SapB family protein [Azospirillum lipoferum]MCP1608409.1 putative Mg2+ transporter-C (MgtC) family protein [Azospirillum lipoferum]MDW5536269.1 MgtC/SapB family protein [Azospirillum sp. NL1]
MGLATVLTVEEIGLRLLAAAFCGALLGLDREMRGKAAGLRTHTLISISCALTTLVALEFYVGLQTTGDERPSDPVRVIQGVAQAVGFISAGVMFRSGDSVRGATTAAVIWVAGALGIACGAGYYMLAGMTLGLCLIVTILFTILLDRFPQLGKEDGDDDRKARERRRASRHSSHQGHSQQGRIRRIARSSPRG